MNTLYIVLLSAGSFFVLFVLDKLMGNRQFSQMSFFDYALGITIGSTAAEISVFTISRRKEKKQKSVPDLSNKQPPLQIAAAARSA